ncbi:MAG TPA: hypothetical protein VGW39_13315 [Chthoniobacterales bacterium]|nr:hypothetical protein [Chthoniobacterales bacterium]
MFPQARSTDRAALSLDRWGLAGCELDIALGDGSIKLRSVPGGPTMADAAMDRMAD